MHSGNIGSGSQIPAISGQAYSGYVAPSGYMPMSGVCEWLSKNYLKVDATHAIKPPQQTQLLLSETSTKIRIYEDRINGWFLDFADHLKNNPSISRHAGFVILSIAVAYIEGVQQYMEGVGSSGAGGTTFNKGLHRIFPTLPTGPDYYGKIRCGLFHNAMTKKGVVLDTYQGPIAFRNGLIEIDSFKFLEAIKVDFRDYIQQLDIGNAVGNKSTLVINFERMWDNPP